MIYIEVNWIHGDDDKPIQVISEVGDDGCETRKVEIFRDGSTGFADSDKHSVGTRLGKIEFPMVGETNHGIEFELDEISQETFDRLWVKHGQNPK